MFNGLVLILCSFFHWCFFSLICRRGRYIYIYICIYIAILYLNFVNYVYLKRVGKSRFVVVSTKKFILVLLFINYCIIFFFFERFYLFIFREGKGDRERENYQCVVAS